MEHCPSAVINHDTLINRVERAGVCVRWLVGASGPCLGGDSRAYAASDSRSGGQSAIGEHRVNMSADVVSVSLEND